MKTKFLPVLLILSGLLVTADKTYACNDPPNADLDASPNPVCVGCSVTLDGSGSSDPDPDGWITDWEWDFDASDGVDWEDPDATGEEVATSYSAADSYTVTLRVTDDDGATDTDTCTVTVFEVLLSPDPLYVCEGGTASLTATVTPDSASSQVDFDTAAPSIATVSGSAPNLTVHGVSAGTTQVRAKLGDCVCETADVTVVGVEIEYPYDANNNGKIDDPTNEFSFNAADPAVLQFYCIAFNSPGADADKFRWTIEDIGTIRGEWSPHVVGDEYTGKGLNPTVTFTGMPNNNSDFGPKTITLSYEGLSCTDNETIEVFFEPLAKNNTGPEPDDIPDTIDLNEVVVKERR